MTTDEVLQEVDGVTLEWSQEGMTVDGEEVIPIEGVNVLRVTYTSLFELYLAAKAVAVMRGRAASFYSSTIAVFILIIQRIKFIDPDNGKDQSHLSIFLGHPYDKTSCKFENLSMSDINPNEVCTPSSRKSSSSNPSMIQELFCRQHLKTEVYFRHQMDKTSCRSPRYCTFDRPIYFY